MFHQFRLRQDSWIKPEANVAGRINRKFQRSFDAQIGDDLIHFTSETQDLHPLSCLIPRDIILSCHEGDNIGFSNENLFINEIFFEQGLPIRTPNYFAIKKEAIKANIALLEKNLFAFGLDSEVNRIMNGTVSNYLLLHEIEAILAKSEIRLSDFASLVGVGEGLTPAGDDFITGVLLSDRLLANNKFVIAESDFEFIAQKTTRQSLMQLCFADKGKLSIRFEHFLAKLFQTQIIEKDFMSCIEHGHSSGSDILWGVYSYLKNAHFELK